MKKTLKLLGTVAIVSVLAASCGTANTAKDESKTPETSENTNTDSSSPQIIIQKQDNEDGNINIEGIMNSEEILEMEEEAKAKIQEALEEASTQLENRTDKSDKVIVIEK